ncbi:PilZ domain-containing protein [Velocimicrobium porci]|uniref:PilZ domain-containing protein n=1 Tax=Velocimicrobium porci TaxID=2606634 RepID=A0A6L5XX69_9FIRM|nr:PilZ domain-containing protein [Velocimicrobium porci]MSS63446.1 PilZ domain-containing protein [Velocimicrobium porci]
MKRNELEKNHKFELLITYNNQTLSYESKIFDFYNEWILIPVITVDKKIVGFSENCNVDFIYADDSQLYRWQNISLKPVRMGKKVLHKIEMGEEGTLYNRRKAFRLFIGEQMKLRYSTEDGRITTQVLVKDVSETGFGFFSKEDLSLKKLVSIHLIDNSMILDLSGTIVRKQKLEDRDSFYYGCQLTHRNDILNKYIVKKQRELLYSHSH